MRMIALDNVAEIIMGQSPPSSTYNNLGKGWPFFQGKSEFGKINPKANKWCTQPKKIAKAGDILISVRAPVGPTNLADQECCIGRGLSAIRPNAEFADKYFIWYFLQYSEKMLAKKGQGSTFEAISGNDLKNLLIPDLPVKKQYRIAVRLEAQLSEVEKAHQAVKAQLQDAQTLKSAILKETFTNHDSKKWPSITLGEAGNVVAGITLGRKVNGKATRSIPYLRVANVKDGHLDLSDVKKIEATDAEIERLLLRPGDILLTEGGDPDKLGRGTFWSGELDECIHQNHIFRVRFPQDSYLPEFIAAQIGSIYGKGYFFSHAKQTTGIATINQTILKNFPVLSPPIETQKTVMAALTSQLDEVEKMIVSIKKQLHEINQLPQKILAQAFEIEP